MNLFTLKAAIVHPFAIVAVLSFLSANGAFAGQSIGDAQQQARNLLSRPIAQQATKAHKDQSRAVGERLAANIDPQEQARRLILGTHNAGKVPTQSVVRAFAESTP